MCNVLNRGQSKTLPKFLHNNALIFIWGTGDFDTSLAKSISTSISGMKPLSSSNLFIHSQMTTPSKPKSSLKLASLSLSETPTGLVGSSNLVSSNHIKGRRWYSQGHLHFTFLQLFYTSNFKIKINRRLI